MGNMDEESFIQYFMAVNSLGSMRNQLDLISNIIQFRTKSVCVKNWQFQSHSNPSKARQKKKKILARQDTTWFQNPTLTPINIPFYNIYLGMYSTLLFEVAKIRRADTRKMLNMVTLSVSRCNVNTWREVLICIQNPAVLMTP